MDLGTIIPILDATLRSATPLVFVCLAGLFSERSGIIDIGLEGKLLISAFFSASVAAMTGSVWIGMMAGIVASLMLSMIHGLASITFRGNQLISGVALNFLASGITVVIGETWFGLGGRTPQLSGSGRFAPIELPGAATLADVPVLGPVYSDLLSGHTILVYLSIVTVALAWWVLFRTRFGLHLRAVGENPESVDTAGISVVRLRYMAMVIAGVLCGIGGAYLATGLAAGFVKEMSAGRGYIALAALIFSKWRPWYALMACLLFGFLDALGNRFQNMELFGINIPTQFMQALPYILTVVILAGFVGRAIPPRAGGQPYVKER
ncbi:ABC transporter permease [Psychromarinibacter sp. C21-152]|uniref:ABC transporter permease n=1 Tax=Psychromarinibacter sediminicola TaxID=3033385 RepID=A0AAE3TAW7_9RHOB|nr:ABC transporter permease [Psychromarinibacter sediminicola]MDF0603278.1 ABC transporter permease [Psychromarinibacter sediminicola]